MDIELTILIILVLLNGFFASAEVALISIKPGELKRMGELGKRGSALKILSGDTGRFLATVQVGVTFAGFLASAFAADAFSDPITDYLEGIGFNYLSHKNLDIVVVVFITIILSFVSLVFGELVPKQIGLRYPGKIALNAAIPLLLFARFTSPFVWILDKSVAVIIRIIGLSKTSEKVSEEEIMALIDLGAESGAIEKSERGMISNVFALNDMPCSKIMIHRSRVLALDENASPDDVAQKFLESGYAVLPVYKNSIDNITGIIYYKDFFGAYAANKGCYPALKDVVKVPCFVPENAKISVLVENMRSSSGEFVILLDEFGGTAGIVTGHDIIHTLVDEKQD